MLRITLVAGVAVGLTACANEPTLPRPGLPPLMLLGAQHSVASEPAEATTSTLSPVMDLARKSMAAKVLSARALEIVTGLKTDPARLSEHD